MLLFNPFRKIAGAKALIIGLAFAAATLIIASFSYAAFDGVLDFHKIRFENWWVYAVLYFVSWIATVFIFGLSGLLFSKTKFRWIDILGTSLLAKAPLLITAIASFFIPELQVNDLKNIEALYVNFGAIFAIILVILCTIWMVALLFKAFAISLNIKGNKLIWSFIPALIASEILSILFIHYLSPFLK